MAAVGATQAVVATLKALVAGPRPPSSDALVEAAGCAFPSGHAATATALYGSLALIAAAKLRGGARGDVLAGALVLVLAIGATRVYLGTHYTTDVLAGGSWALRSRPGQGGWPEGCGRPPERGGAVGRGRMDPACALGRGGRTEDGERAPAEA